MNDDEYGVMWMMMGVFAWGFAEPGALSSTESFKIMELNDYLFFFLPL